MTSQNTPDSTPADAPDPTHEDPGTRGPAPERPTGDADAPGASGDSGAPRTDGTVLLVRRRRAPALGFWVLLALVVGVLAGAVTALVTGVADAGGVIYFAVTGAVFIGFPLALIAAIVDSVTHRGERRGRR